MIFTFLGNRRSDFRSQNSVSGTRFGANSLQTTAKRLRGHSQPNIGFYPTNNGDCFFFPVFIITESRKL
jgi:hypothetical protein